MKKALCGVWKKKPMMPLDAAAAPSEDWEKEYSFEEKMLKSRIDDDKQGYENWEKKNRSWEIQNGLVPTTEAEEEPVGKNTVRLYKSASLLLEDQKRQEDTFNKRLLQHQGSKNVVQISEEERKKFAATQPYCKKKQQEAFINMLLSGEKSESEKENGGLRKTTTCGPGLQGRKKVAPTLEDLQYLCKKSSQPTRILSREEQLQRQIPEEERKKLAAQEGCLSGSYLTPYCKCDKRSYRFDTTLEDRPPEFLPIWLAYCRQFRQSHCFDIDDYIGGRVWPLEPSQDFEGKAELLMELANRAIQDYNEKYCNVFKYKVMKVEKVNCSVATNTYWMTVKVLNLTLGTPIETFQIHAGTRHVDHGKVFFCCRPKEEVTIGSPCCEFCFGLLPERLFTEVKEP